MKTIVGVLALALTACVSAPAVDNHLLSAVASFAQEEAPEYKHAMVDLDNDGVEDAVVLLQGMGWCGSGGCTMLVLKGADTGYGVVSNSTVTRAPVRVSNSASQGWRDLIVHSDGAEKLMQFDGEAYPANPSMQSSATKEQVDAAATILP